MARILVVLAILGPWSALARAAERRGADEVEAAAATVRKAVEASDDARISHVARGVAPDPWLVADVLVMGGHATAARRLAAAVPSPHGEGLVRWLDDARPAAPSTFATYREVRAATCEKAWGKAEACARAAEAALGDDPTSLVVRYERARALGGLGRHADAARAAGETAAAAEGLGWWRQAAIGRHFEALETLLVSPVRSAQCWRALERVALAARDDGLRATALEGLATSRERARDVLGAVEAIDEAVALRERIGEPGPWARAEATRGALLLATGDKAQARVALEGAIRRAEAVDDTATLVTALAGLGMLHLTESDAGAAVPLLLRAAEAARRLDAAEQAARVLVQLATARRAIGETSAALQDLSVAEELFERVGDPQGRVRALITTALLKSDIGDVAGALRAGRTAISIATAAGDTEGEMLACSRLACNWQAIGEDAASEDLLARCRLLPGVGDDAGVAASRRLGSVRSADDARAVLEDLAPLLASARRRKDRPSVARFVLQSAVLRFVAGDLDGAQRDFTEAETAATALRDERLAAAAQAGTASLYLATGNHAAALAWARTAAERVERLVHGLADDEGAWARAEWRDVYVIGAVAAAALGELDREYWFHEAGRAGALLEALGAREVARGLAVPRPLLDRADAARRAESLAAVTASALATANADLRDLLEAQRSRDEAAERVREADAAIDRHRKESQTFYPQPADLATVQGALEPGEALVAYRLSAGQASALVVTGKDVRRVPLGAADDVRAAAAFDPSADGREARAAIDRARAALVDGLGLSPRVKRVLVVPDGDLAYVPFGALLPDVDVALVPSATVYVRLRPRAALTGDGVLALGDPVYGRPSVGGKPGPQLLPLPGTGREAEAFGDVKLLRERATVEGLFGALAQRRRWRAVHLGCHGVLDPAHPGMSALYVTATATNDGRIRAADLLRATLEADVVVLSACETARGTVMRAEGVMGLARAAMHAGATRVVASLWKVDDAATERLMTEFHGRMKAGARPAQALREAQAVVRAQPGWSHPSFWAAWVLWGLPQ